MWRGSDGAATGCTRAGAPARVVAEVVARFGRIDILVNNASVWLRSPFLSITAEAWQLALDVNLTGPFLVSQAVAPHMLKQESGLISTSPTCRLTRRGRSTPIMRPARPAWSR